jgi:hypothetical protein
MEYEKPVLFPVPASFKSSLNQHIKGTSPGSADRLKVLIRIETDGVLRGAFI